MYQRLDTFLAHQFPRFIGIVISPANGQSRSLRIKDTYDIPAFELTFK
jgi:hypothetical protein